MVMDFSDIDFKGGKVRTICWLDEDMLEVFYPNNYMIDVGYIEDMNTFFISIIKNGDWKNIHKEISARSEAEVKNALRWAVDYVTSLQ
jgi:hypothetical protein